MYYTVLYILGDTAAGIEGVDSDLVIVECGTLRFKVKSSSVESPLWPDVVGSPSCDRDFCNAKKKKKSSLNYLLGTAKQFIFLRVKATYFESVVPYTEKYEN